MYPICTSNHYDDYLRLAHTDDLTGLYNRRRLNQLLHEAIQNAVQTQTHIAMLSLDLDGLKAVNDTWGHPRGDRLLIDFAQILRGLVRPMDIVARVSGDEYAIILVDVSGNEAIRIAERIRRVVSETMFDGEPPLRITTSIGMAVFPQDAHSMDLLVQIADKLLYVAKRAGRNRVATAAELISEPPAFKPFLTEARLVARADELAVLGNALEQSRSGKLQCVMIQGELGLGRSRLLREFRAIAQLTGARVIYEKCYEQNQGIPYQAVREMLQRYFSEHPDDAYANILEIPEHLRQEFVNLIPDLDAAKLNLPVSSSRTIHHPESHILFAVEHFFKQLSDTMPIVLLLDDLQWLDDSSMKLLNHLLRRSYSQQMVFVGTIQCRESQDTTTQRTASYRWVKFFRDFSQIIFLQLKRFDLSQTQELIYRLLGQTMPPIFIRQIYDESEGNPYIIEELLKYLRDQFILERNRDGWIYHEQDRLPTPESVRDQMLCLIDGLSQEELQALEYAAVIGHHFTFDTLRQATKINEGHLLDILSVLLTKQIVQRSVSDSDEHYQFTHNNIRKVIYNKLEPRLRKRMHQRIIEVLEWSYRGKTELVVCDLAMHYIACGSNSAAVHLYERAGDIARSIPALGEAMRYYQDAVNLLKDVNGNLDGEPYILYQKIASVYHDQGRIQDAMKMYRMSLVGGSQKEMSRKAFVYRSIADIMIAWNQYAMASTEIAMAGNMLKLYPDSAESLRLNITRAALAFHQRDYSNCRKILHAITGELKDRGMKRELSEVYIIEAQLELQNGNKDLTKYLFDLSLKLKTQINDRYGVSRIYMHTASFHWKVGSYMDAIVWLQKCLNIEESLGRPEFQIKPLRMIAEIRYRLEDVCQAEQDIIKALDLSESSGSDSSTIECLIVLMMIYLQKERIQEALRVISRAEHILNQHGVPDQKCNVLLARVRLELANKHYSQVRIFLSDVFRNEASVDVLCKANTFYLSGCLEKALGNGRDALKLFQDAASIYRSEQYLYELADSLIHQASIYDQQHDRTDAGCCLMEARSLLVELGAFERQRRIDILLDSLGK